MDTADDSDEALMLAYQAGDMAAFDRLYERHRGSLYRFVLRQCRSPAHAEELFQDVWLNLIQARDRYRPDARFAAYLYTLARHRLTDHHRRAGRFEQVVAADELPELAASRVDEPHVRHEAKEKGARILALLEKMPAAQREAFLLRVEGGLSLEEIAQVTGVGFETAKSRLRYALVVLRDGLEQFA